MTFRTGPRPLTIRVFAAAFLASAIIAYIDGLWNIPSQLVMFRSYLPEFAWSEDAVIVLLSARLSIALIPIALVWLLASNFARWMVTVLGLGKLINVPMAVSLVAEDRQIDPAWLSSFALGLLAVAVLFTPASNRWFARKDAPSPEIFE